MNEKAERTAVEREIAHHVFGNAPTLLALCLTVIGLIKIYASLQRVTTLADNLLLVAVVAFLVATIFSYLSLRATGPRRRARFGAIADGAFLLGLSLATAVALFITFTLAG